MGKNRFESTMFLKIAILRRGIRNRETTRQVKKSISNGLIVVARRNVTSTAIVVRGSILAL